MALGSFGTISRLRRRFGFNLIDAHFAYPDGLAAVLLGRWFRVPVTVTIRGTEVRLSRTVLRSRMIVAALRQAACVFSVSESLRRHAVGLGIAEEKIRVVGNAVDPEKFHPVPKAEARRALGLPPDVPVLVSVGDLVERKGFHRVIECLPSLRRTFPGLRYLIVGGRNPRRDWTSRLTRLVGDLGLEDAVSFLGFVPHDRLKVPLSAADVFVLATRAEGWANVFLETMACGLPVVTTSVGGNPEVVSRPELGTLVPYGDPRALQSAVEDALRRDWDRAAIIRHARENSWDARVATLVETFTRLV